MMTRSTAVYLVLGPILALAGYLADSWNALDAPHALRVAGLLAGLVIAVGAAAIRTSQRWPAAVTLICTAPVAQLMLERCVACPGCEVDQPEQMMLDGSLMVVCGVVFVLMCGACTPAVPVARAVAHRRRSE
jgi:hypothetical protein